MRDVAATVSDLTGRGVPTGKRTPGPDGELLLVDPARARGVPLELLQARQPGGPTA